jgi:2,5-furandicarboxylate decarboxylase 1
MLVNGTTARDFLATVHLRWRPLLPLPATIGDYTDFFVGIHHARNAGRLLRPDHPLLPNYKYVPIGYHGRASSIRPSGIAVVRPEGQRKHPNAASPGFGATERLDYELELGVWIGPGNRLGEPIPIEEAFDHIAGYCLLNDWSARDFQAWEYQPLGPFLGKNFHSTISPWVVTAEALAPFHIAPEPRPEGDPKPLGYLWSDADQRSGALAIALEVRLLTDAMRKSGLEPFSLGRTSVSNMYWTVAQMVTHHTSNGCNLSRRLARDRNDFRHERRFSRLVARDFARRHGSFGSFQRRDAHVSPRWRRSDHDRERASRRPSVHRFRTMQSDCPSGSARRPPMTDFDRFRLRRFIENLVAAAECVVCEEPLDLVDIAAALDGSPKAVWFKTVGPERAELVGNVMGSRQRLALALGTDVASLPNRLRDAVNKNIPPIEVSSAEAPVHAMVQIGAEADLLSLPVNLQHGRDGAPYISAAIDFARDPSTGGTNIGVRRMMLRGSREAGVDLNAPSDLRAIYQQAAARGARTEVAYMVGAHPADFLAGTAASRSGDELGLMGALRGSPVPVVKCRTIDVLVPADAEFVLEGYLDPAGFVEPEGPYGEFLGYYGEVKRNPVFHLTAITRRADALFQTATIGGRFLRRTDTAQLVAAKTEATIWRAREQAVREPVSVCCSASSGGMFNVKVAIRQRYPGEARNAIAAVFGSVADIKHVFVVDDDIDVFDDDQLDWALATRFQADRDIVIASGFRAVPIDPSLAGARTGAKAGFDCTKRSDGAKTFDFSIPEAPILEKSPYPDVHAALRAGPASFLELMSAAGSRDGRDVLRELEALHAQGRITRDEDGRYRKV